MRSVLIGLVAAIALLALGWAAAHAFIPPVNPLEERPPGHVAGPCWACHVVTEAAPVRTP